MAEERSTKKKRSRPPRAAEAAARPSEPDRGGHLRLLGVLAALIGVAVYALDLGSAVIMAGIIALVGLTYWKAPKGEGQPRRLLAAGSVLLLAGIGLVGIGPHEIGVGLTLLAMLVMAFGIHTFGRLGPEEPSPGG